MTNVLRMPTRGTPEICLRSGLCPGPVPPGRQAYHFEPVSKLITRPLMYHRLILLIYYYYYVPSTQNRPHILNLGMRHVRTADLREGQPVNRTSSCLKQTASHESGPQGHQGQRVTNHEYPSTRRGESSPETGCVEGGGQPVLSC